MKNNNLISHRYGRLIKLYIFLLLSSLIFFLLSSSALADIRYVSKTGSSTPPYTSWETAADSIQKCIDISQFGDTIYVANGVYKEQVVMIPGLSLIGAGMDSCVIDIRELVTSQHFFAVEVKDTCLLKGFLINVYYNTDWGHGIVGGGSKHSLVTLNKVINANIGIFLDETFFGISDITVYKNIFDNVRKGVELFNSNSLIRSNIIYTDMTFRGIDIGAFTTDYTPHIDSNYIVAYQAIHMFFGTKATFSNNRIFLSEEFSSGIFGGNPDTTWIYNNLIVAEGEEVSGGIGNFVEPAVNYNNLLVGVFIARGISARNYNVITNNNIINGQKGIIVPTSQDTPIVKYNNSWNNEINYGGFTPDSTNLSVDPMVVNDDTTKGELDFHLQMFSPLIDAGDPNILDKDGTRSDIGLYGGPFGESYVYIDLPPKPPVNLTALIDTNLIKLSWNKNTEADFNYYNLYRDTTANFTIDSTKLVASLVDTFYNYIIPKNFTKLYFKLTAVDSQGNVSEPSEEIAVYPVSVDEEPIIISNYRLYQNYPNPFNPTTKIGYKLKEEGYVKLYVYDIKGELVATLVNQTQQAGYYEVEFTGNLNVETGQAPSLSSGVYIYQIMITNGNNIPVFTDMKKMLLLK